MLFYINYNIINVFQYILFYLITFKQSLIKNQEFGKFKQKTLLKLHHIRDLLEE